MVLVALGLVALLALIFGPQLWIRSTMARHSRERADFPGTGGELARHLLDEAGLAHVKVEAVSHFEVLEGVCVFVRATVGA